MHTNDTEESWKGEKLCYEIFKQKQKQSVTEALNTSQFHSTSQCHITYVQFCHIQQSSLEMISKYLQITSFSA